MQQSLQPKNVVSHVTDLPTGQILDATLEKCSEFLALFTHISIIRSYISHQFLLLLLRNHLIQCLHLQWLKMVKEMKPLTCPLDTLPVKFWKDVFSTVTLSILQILNCSLSIGSIPEFF